MRNPHYRLTVDYGRGASPRHYDYASHEAAEALAELAELAALAADDSTATVSVTLVNLAKIAERDELDRIAAARGGDDDTPDAIVDAINAGLLAVYAKESGQ